MTGGLCVTRCYETAPEGATYPMMQGDCGVVWLRYYTLL